MRRNRPPYQNREGMPEEVTQGDPAPDRRRILALRRPAGAGAPVPARLLDSRNGPGARALGIKREGPPVPGAEPRWAGPKGHQLMEDDPEQLDQYVEDLLADRRPERTPLENDDALEARRVAAMLRAARPGATLPSREFGDRV